MASPEAFRLVKIIDEVVKGRVLEILAALFPEVADSIGTYQKMEKLANAGQAELAEIFTGIIEDSKNGAAARHFTP